MLLVRTPALLLSLALLATGCGGSDEPASGKPEPLATATGSPLVGGLESGEVTGRLVRATEDGTTSPVRGEVTFASEDGSVARTQVDSGGEFRIQLSPGRYTLRGSSPGIDAPCVTDPPTTILEKGGVVIVDIVCPAG